MEILPNKIRWNWYLGSDWRQLQSKNTESNVTINEAAIIRKYDLQGTNQSQDDDSDYSDAPCFSNVSEFKNAAISYIAGYVAQMVQKKTTCCVCHEAVGSREHRCESAFLTLKDRGNLFKPAASVISVCTEKCYCKVRLYQLWENNSWNGN
jgi:hypothetical protein